MLATSLSLRLYDMIKKKDDVFAMIRYWCRIGKFGLAERRDKKDFRLRAQAQRVQQNCKTTILTKKVKIHESKVGKEDNEASL